MRASSDAELEGNDEVYNSHYIMPYVLLCGLKFCEIVSCELIKVKRIESSMCVGWMV